MVNFRSKEDDVAQISTSMYVSNIPDSIHVKDLFQACKQYGHVVDSFILIKRDKYGNRFGFVRFINVFNTQRSHGKGPKADVTNSYVQTIPNVKTKVNTFSKGDKSFAGVVEGRDISSGGDMKSDPVLVLGDECLVSKDLSLTLFGRVKEFTSLAYLKVAIGNEGFSEIVIKSHGKGPKADVTNSYVQTIPNVKTKVNTFSKGDKSFAGVVERRDISSGGDMKSNPVLVLGDECLGSKDLSLTLFGRVKEFASLANLKVAIGNEGFSEIVIKECVSIASWFSQIINDSINFEIEGRIAWVEVEGVPFKLWSGNTFRRIANKWGGLLDVDDQDDNCYHSKRICIQMKSGRNIKDEFNIMHKGKKYWIRINKTPGWVPDFTDDLNDEDQEDMESNPEDIDNQESENHDNCLNDSGLDNDSDMDEVPETCFEDGKSMNSKDDGDNYPPKTELSDDPFKIYPLLNKHKSEDGSINKMGDSLKFSPGFTPMDEKDKISNNEGEKHFHNNVDVTSAPRENMNVEVIGKQNSLKNKECGNESMASGHFKQSECPRITGSILSLLEKEFLHQEISKWRREVIIMGDFNEVRFTSDRFKSNFNEHGAHMFNSFIVDSGLVEVPLGGCHFTWCLKSAKKMRKLDRLLVSKNLQVSCPHLTAVTLERYLSDHRPILLRENHYDYGPTSFWFFHHWIQTDGFDRIVSESWKNSPSRGTNAMKSLMYELKHLKHDIREWNKHNMVSRKNMKIQYKKNLEAVDQILDSGKGVDEDICVRSEIIRKLQKCDEIDSMELAQKAKIKWAIEGDENSKFFQGTLNKKRNILNIWGIMVDGIWVYNSKSVKREFLDHFSKRFCKPDDMRATLIMEFPNRLHPDQSRDLEMSVSNEEIKKAVWDCGTDKAPGCNSSFIALIPKIPDANMVKDFRPISLIGSVYKIIAKILLNQLVNVLGDIVSEVQSVFVANRQILDGPFILNEDFLDDVLCKFGFGDKWRRWIQCCLQSSRGSIASLFEFGKGLKQGDSLSPFLFILIMENLHLSFKRVVEASLFHGVKLHDTVTLSHLFYADDAVFVGRWSQRNISTLTHVLKCFHKASGLKINMCKSKILGIHVNNDYISRVAKDLGCQTYSCEIGSWIHAYISYVIVQSPSRVIKAIHGMDGSIGDIRSGNSKSCWSSIINEINGLSSKGIKLMNYLRITLGNGVFTHLWDESWHVEGILKDRFPRIYALENCKSVTVGDKLAHQTVSHSFRRLPRGGIENAQFAEFSVLLQQVVLAQGSDRWTWTANGSGQFSVASVRKIIDNKLCSGGENSTRWIRCVPIKSIFTLGRSWRDHWLLGLIYRDGV
nr:RNA-directed DNA polymerase, eukaryota [Tanacetum cinerariifolium]